MDPERNMKCFLALAVEEAVKLALADSVEALELVKARDITVGHHLHHMLWGVRGPEWVKFAATMRECGDRSEWWGEDWEGGKALAKGYVSRARFGRGGWLLTIDDLAAVEFVVFDPQEKLLVRRETTAEEREAMHMDAHAWPTNYVDFDPGALARNVSNRLLGSGGWEVGGHYCGNATAREITNASIADLDRDEVAELLSDLGIGEEGL